LAETVRPSDDPYPEECPCGPEKAYLQLLGLGVPPELSPALHDRSSAHET